MRYTKQMEAKRQNPRTPWLTLLLLLPACGLGWGPSRGQDRETFLIASTTSTQDSGILDALIPAFEKEFPNYSAKVVAVGSGEAIQLGVKGDADVLLVHSPIDERIFMLSGNGLYRKPVMANAFAIAGPRSDPAMVRGTSMPGEALQRIAAVSAAFVSRGDGSGTHKRELSLWQSAGMRKEGGWYLETGQGMGETITIAAEKSAYLLTDTATFLVFGPRTGLEILLEGGKALDNPYSVIPIRGARHREAAETFAGWLTGPPGQSLIAAFGRQEYGKPLFTPANL